jgi:phosphoribosylamine--glycine ligase
VPVVGPGSPAARLESSKAFSKSFMIRHSLPTAAAEEIADAAALEQRLRASPGARLVIKKSGLAGGKGVLESSDPDRLLEFGRGILPHDRLLVEEYLEGWEVSVFGLSDGRSHVVLPPCADFKKAGEADTGPNTGGMGAICPVPWVTPELMDRIIGEVVEPTYAALRAENLDYAGVLYFGLMITPSGPRILEFNVRFGDPETQVLVPMLPFDLGEAIAAIADRSLAGLRLPGTGTPSQEHGGALGVVVASRGYPESSEKGTLVKSLPTPEEGGALLFHASTTMDSNGDIRTGGGRCFTVVGLGEDLRRAGEHAYAAASRVRFGGAWFRRDIGRKFMEDRP